MFLGSYAEGLAWEGPKKVKRFAKEVLKYIGNKIVVSKTALSVLRQSVLVGLIILLCDGGIDCLAILVQVSQHVR